MAGRLEHLAKVFERAWEDLIYDRATELPTLMDVDEIDAKWIAYLKPLLGFTDDLSFDATTEELRRILRSAIPYWNRKPAEEAVSFAIRMVTGNRFRAANFFDFRMQIDSTAIMEELEDLDPHAISFPGNKWTGVNGVLGEAGADFADLRDAPDVFAYNSAWGWLTIEDPTYPANDGIYQVRLTTPGTRFGYVYGAWATSHANPVNWELIGWMDEYITEVRLVDHGVGTLAYRDLTSAFTPGDRVFGATSGAYATIVSDAPVGDAGTLSLKKIVGRFEDNEGLSDDSGGAAVAGGELLGVLNRDLLAFLAELVRPQGERLDVVYINFLEQFLTPADIDQWTVATGGALTVASPGGVGVLTSGTRIEDADPHSDDWGDQVTAWKFVVDAADTDAVCEFTFMGADDANHYFVRIDFSTKGVSLWKKVATANTQIGSTVTLPVLKAGVQEVVRVDVLKEGSDTRIRVKLAGDLRIDEAVSPSAFTKGKVGAFASNKDLRLKLVEVNVLPAEVGRVGQSP